MKNQVTYTIELEHITKAYATAEWSKKSCVRVCDTSLSWLKLIFAEFLSFCYMSWMNTTQMGGELLEKYWTQV